MCVLKHGTPSKWLVSFWCPLKPLQRYPQKKIHTYLLRSPTVKLRERSDLGRSCWSIASKPTCLCWRSKAGSLTLGHCPNLTACLWYHQCAGHQLAACLVAGNSCLLEQHGAVWPDRCYALLASENCCYESPFRLSCFWMSHVCMLV